MSDSIAASAEYGELLDSIKETIATGRRRAARAVNNLMIETYWAIGRDIVARQQEQARGARVIERLSADLQAAHPGRKGLSPRNLEYMATLATRWTEPIAQQAAARLPWGHVMVILDKCPTKAVSDFYAQRAADEGWTRDVLQAMIASQLHERTQPLWP
jgi:predicted nuclease of restriction endonuclease-like (RecB) superfamily